MNPTTDIQLLNIDWNKLAKIDYWWKHIKIDNPIKYKADTLKSTDISYDFANKVYKAMGGIPADNIDIFFDNEPWDFNIERNMRYGYPTFTMYTHGATSPWRIYYSELGINEKRSIMQRLNEKKFYIYTYKGYNSLEYILRETPEFNGEKGVEL